MRFSTLKSQVTRYFYHALKNLLSAKLRSFLAVLGILVGTASVVALISASQLATDAALMEFKALGTDLMALSIYQSNPKAGLQSFKLSEWQQLASAIPDVAAMAPYSTAYQPLSMKDVPLEGVVVGADESLADLMHIELKAGHFVSGVDNYERFAVVGADLAQQIKLQHPLSIIGVTIRVGNTLYTVIGELKPWTENGFFGENLNHALIVPIKSMALLSKDTLINNALIQLKPGVDIDKVIDELTATAHLLAPNLTLYPRTAKQIIASMESQGRIFTWLLGIIGGIALLVGGIGVMNVMLVSVSERKKEIGLRKAIGATRRDITVLFLTESVILSLIGGSLGVILGMMLTYIIAYFSHWPFVVLLFPPVAGVAVSTLTGVFFGFYPAKRAASWSSAACLRES